MITEFFLLTLITFLLDMYWYGQEKIDVGHYTCKKKVAAAMTCLNSGVTDTEGKGYSCV